MKTSKKSLLLSWIRSKGRARTHEVIEWGLQNFTTGADRYARKLAQEGKLRRMNDQEKSAVYGRTKEDVWEVVNASF